MRRNKISFFSLLLLVALSACTVSGGQQASQSPQPSNSPPESEQANLVALFYLRKDNLSNDLKAEIYPIAFLFNDRYVDASVDVTQRPGYPAAIEGAKQKSLLKSIRQFSVTQQGEQLGTFKVDKISPGRFQCSEILTGKGQFKQASLADIFERISLQHQEQERGYIDGKEFNQTLKWGLAISDYYPTTRPQTGPQVDQDQAKYRRDLLAIAQSSKSQPENKRDASLDQPELVSLTVVDLDRDGNPEVFGKLRTTLAPTGPEPQRTAYTGLWLTYKNQQPQVLVDFRAKATEANWGNSFDLVGTTDITGNGIEEVIMKISGYESQSFGIYEYKNNALEKAFQGAGFGC